MSILAGLPGLPAILANAASGMPEPSIISFDIELIKNLVLVLINVVIVVLVLTLILYKPVRAFMDKRKAGIQSDLEEAEKAREEVELLRAECEKQRLQIEKDREEILANAHKKAMERSESIFMEAREEAESIHKQARIEMEEERASMQAEIKRQLIELSVLVAERFVEVSIDEATQNKYVDEAIANWEETLWLD